MLRQKKRIICYEDAVNPTSVNMRNTAKYSYPCMLNFYRKKHKFVEKV